jgi:hypothetical protein
MSYFAAMAAMESAIVDRWPVFQIPIVVWPQEQYGMGNVALPRFVVV